MMPLNNKLFGEFVNLRPLAGTDAELTFKWRSATRAQYLNQSAANVEQQANWIASRPLSEYNFIIELKNGNSIGMLSLTEIDDINKHGQPGRFLIGDEVAAQGLPVAVESMKLLYELAFDQLELLRVFGIVAANNKLMIKWQKYLGMKVEGRLRKHLRQKNGLFEDAIYLGMLVDEYRVIALPRMRGLIAAAHAK
jgi:RimJ/RimL family protein N-acetyltransferase